MKYQIEEIDESGFATVRYPDGSWAKFMLDKDMKPEDVDNLAYQFRPKTGSVPIDLSVGDSREAKPSNSQEDDYIPNPDWLEKRIAAYGNIQSQLEFIAENGLEAWQEEVAMIKKQFPKVDE